MNPALQQLQQQLVQCRRCPNMAGPPVHGEAVDSAVMLIGQAPGNKEIELHKPFAWTAGKTLFRWFHSIGLDETEFRRKVYMSAVCRCFPGKKPRGGDRLPDATEIANCARWLEAELDLLRPALVIPVGKLAIGRFLTFRTLKEVIGTVHTVVRNGHSMDLIPLPHPSGASTWHVTEPGKTLLHEALEQVASHPAFTGLLR